MIPMADRNGNPIDYIQGLDDQGVLPPAQERVKAMFLAVLEGIATLEGVTPLDVTVVVREMNTSAELDLTRAERRAVHALGQATIDVLKDARRKARA